MPYALPRLSVQYSLYIWPPKHTSAISFCTALSFILFQLLYTVWISVEEFFDD